MATRRLRAFKRWMSHQGIEWSKSVELKDTIEEGASVKAISDLKEGDVVATIPKHACLTIKTSGAKDMIESASFEGYLALSFALMYETSLGGNSPWAGYLQFLPDSECLPLVWTLDELDLLLRGTELHKTVKEDKALVYEDWKDCILPLLVSAPAKLNPNYFGPEQYFAAKSLIASRSFAIDDYHGFGMVPFADLFNHKTGAEDVHFTSGSSHSESDNDDDNKNSDDHDSGDDKLTSQNSQNSHSESLTSLDGKISNRDNSVRSSTLVADSTILEMIMVKDVKAGHEVFNTYGSLGNAALLHRYGFTEPDNPYSIVNIDLELVLEWSSSLFSGRYSRSRLPLWRKLDYSGCVSENCEYFEISADGVPEVELLILLYIMLLPEDAFNKVDLAVSTAGGNSNSNSKALSIVLSKQSDVEFGEALLTSSVCDALLSLADIREGLYGLNSIEDDMKVLSNSCCVKERKLYHSLMLRVSERRILERLRIYANASKRGLARKKMKMA